MQSRLRLAAFPAAFLLATLASTPAIADTIVPSGDLVDQTWTRAGSPYRITGDVRVPAAVTVVIEPGAEIVAGDDVELAVAGALRAEGTADAPVTFRGPGWDGIVVASGATQARLQHVVIRDASRAISNRDAGAALDLDHARLVGNHTGLYLVAGAPVIGDVTVEGGGGNGVEIVGGSPTLDGLVVRGHADGVYVADASPTLLRARIFGNRYTGVVIESGFALISRSSIDRNVVGIEVRGSGRVVDSIVSRHRIGIEEHTGSSVEVEHSNVGANQDGSGWVRTGTGNISANPLFVSDDDLRLTSNSPSRFGASDGGAMGALPYDGVPTPGLHGVLWESRTLTRDGSPYLVDGDLTVSRNATLIIHTGVTVRFGTDPANPDLMQSGGTSVTELVVDGTLRAIGNETALIRLESSPTTRWGGVRVTAGAPTASLHDVEIRRADTGIDGSHIDLWRTSIIDSSAVGLRLPAGGSSLRNVTVVGGRRGVEVTGGMAHFRGLYVSDAEQGIVADNITMFIDGCVVRGSQFDGIQWSSTGTNFLDITMCTIADNGRLPAERGAGIAVRGPGRVDIDSSIFVRNLSEPIAAMGTGPVSISHSNVWRNGAALSDRITVGQHVMSANPLFVSATDLHLTSNSPSRYGGTSGAQVGGLPYDGVATPGLYGVIWHDQGISTTGVVEGDLIIARGATLTLSPGTALQFGGPDGSDVMESGDSPTTTELIVHGRLDGIGHLGVPISLTSSSTHRWGGIIVTGGLGLRSATVERALVGVDVRGGGATLDNVRLFDGGTGVRVATGALEIDGLTVARHQVGVAAVDASLTLRNAVVRDSGTGIRWTSSDPSRRLDLSHVTVHRNRDAGIDIDGSGTAQISNSIITGTSNGPGVRRRGAATATVTVSDVWGNATDLDGASPGAGVLSAEPLFVANDDLRLKAGSPGLDVATSGAAVDRNGSRRPLDSDGDGVARWDLGAYEYEWRPTCGNGVVERGETCDDGRDNGQYGRCSTTCRGPGPRCGDGQVNGPEQCDDRNTNDGDACLTTCVAARCGDGVIRTGVERCDDGNTVDTDACRATCVPARCGDGVIHSGVEACDDGNAVDTDACRATCELARCGDGVVHGGVEACDDGNTVDTDACLGTCAAASCGDGVVHGGVETCDDGNRDDSDACLGTCAAARCGDGVVHGGVETCDDGNRDDSDACLGTCATARCGDGVIQAGVETCDDGNGDDTDACLGTCRAARCGDGVVHGGVETCDDGNDVDTDACRTSCAVARCGDGVVEAGVETCDDGNDVDTDACRNSCRSATCGDGIVQAGVEACDDGNDVDTDACLATCVAASCGDGLVQVGVETCDDGNDVDTDACRNSCRSPTCGDGVVQAGTEACDDGNDVDTDDCLTACVAARCGDRVVHAGVETCDDGNADDGDACLATCVAARCGDGVVQTGVETCDDGNDDDDDACRNSCRSATCGDGVVQVGAEPCDDGNADDTDACLATCVEARCGDRVVEAGVEACDDGNDIDTDACNRCAVARCGDSAVQTGVEPCDDGNADDTDACLATCVEARCGDGHVRAGQEDCDDGNDQSGDGCSPLCVVEPAPDAGAPDAGAPDAMPAPMGAPDAGDGPTLEEGGCGCRTGGGSPVGAALLVLAVVLARRRRG